jgi:hypothetical protein
MNTAMKFLKKLLLVFTIAGLAGFLALLWLIKFRPAFKPCEPFEAYFGNDTLLFPIEGAEARIKFGEMKYDTLPPFLLHSFRGDTLILAHFRSGYETGKFNKNGHDTSIRRINDKSVENYDAKGIYAFSFIFSPTSYSDTHKKLIKQYGSNHLEKISFYHKTPYLIWTIGPCHHLLLIRKKPTAEYHGLKMDQEYTYALFVYNLSEKEINDVVETDGTIRNDIF